MTTLSTHEDLDAEDLDEPQNAELDASDGGAEHPEVTPKSPSGRARMLSFVVLPAVVLVLAVLAAYLKYQDANDRAADTARIESVLAARDSTVAMLSYQPDTVEEQLTAARELLTAEFRDSYGQLINDVVIPGAKEQSISAVASVPAVSSVSAQRDRAVVLLFVNQTVTVGDSAPTDTTSSVRVTLDKVDGRWLVSQFEPI